MDVFEAIRSRRSIRSFQDRPVDDKALEQILEAGRLAPSAGNRQDWLFVVVRDAEKRKAIAKACHDQAFVGQAPVVIVACATDLQHRMSSGLNIAAVDPTIAVDHMTLAATALGLGTCWIGAFDPSAVGKLLGLSEGVAPAHVLPLGHPAETPAARPRKPLDEVVRHDA